LFPSFVVYKEVRTDRPSFCVGFVPVVDFEDLGLVYHGSMIAEYAFVLREGRGGRRHDRRGAARSRAAPTKPGWGTHLTPATVVRGGGVADVPEYASFGCTKLLSHMGKPLRRSFARHIQVVGTAKKSTVTRNKRYNSYDSRGKHTTGTLNSYRDVSGNTSNSPLATIS